MQSQAQPETPLTAATMYRAQASNRTYGEGGVTRPIVLEDVTAALTELMTGKSAQEERERRRILDAIERLMQKDKCALPSLPRPCCCSCSLPLLCVTWAGHPIGASVYVSCMWLLPPLRVCRHAAHLWLSRKKPLAPAERGNAVDKARFVR